MPGKVKSISINLERESGIFYAGEVVRGTVTLTTTGAVTSRGLRLQLKEVSLCHWHTGSGDDRNDYEGKTVYQDQRHTLFGNYYVSGRIDNAGANAIFGRANGDGTMYIPCSFGDDRNMQLIVRVMDYDFGKRDDLLGEILLDVSDLAGSGEIKSFPLTRKGRPDKGEVTLSAKFLPFDAVFPVQTRSGVSVSSSAVASLCLVLIVHQATGLRKADLFGKNDVYVQVYRPSPEDNIVVGKKLPEPTKKTKLPTSETTFPFAFQLRGDAPGSAEFKVGDRSYLRYDLYSNVDFANWSDPSTRRTITVIPNRPVPTTKLLIPLSEERLDEPIYSCTFCGLRCFRENGSASVKLNLGRLAYAPGERLDLSESSVVNETKKPKKVTVVLRQYTKLTCSTGREHMGNCEFIILQTSCGPSQKLSFGGNLPLETLDRCRIPVVPPSFLGGASRTSGRTAHEAVKWTYSLELRVGADKGTCGSAIFVRVPLLISAAPPFSKAIEEAKNLTPDEVDDDPWLLHKYAVTGPDPCNTTPRITGPEDGGAVTSADGFGPISTADRSEDRAAVGSSVPYQPVVNVFDSKRDPGHDIVDDTASESTLGNEENDFSLFLQDLANSIDKRETVGKWVAEHPLQVASLTPEQVSEVMSEVTFVLEQASVAAELSAGFERFGGLTCAHIQAAVRVCKYSTADVAKAMAPYVNDPENKEIVLDEIQYSFEKDSVARCFPE